MSASPKVKTFRRISVPRDGDCFYHALAVCLNTIGRESPTIEFLRRRIYNYLRRAGKPEEAARARTMHTWAENEEVSAAASIFRLNIRVWEGANGFWVGFGDERHPRVYMYNPDNVHFEPIIPVTARGSKGLKGRVA